MNCLSSSTIRCLLLLGIGIAGACGAPASEQSAAEKPLHYDISYTVVPDPAGHRVAVTLQLSQDRRLLRELTFPLRESITDIDGDGTVATSNGLLRWQPPTGGGELRWNAAVEHRRNDGGYDAWLSPDWGLFRAEDIIPRAATRTLKGATSRTQLHFELPPNWSVVTQYAERDGGFRIRNSLRRFDEPTGWIVMGELGVRRETIAGIRVAIAAPVGESQRRMDTLALLNWTLPELARILPELPARLTIVSAGDPMWRGGLSGPQSLYVHADRPLLSEN
ncbi:MAG: hypothetical protein KJO82_05575, partial [Gammaproteobacteria bacterium]|nr:hypothetical protein [Gammaproteobacteria bacterium]